MAGEKRYTISDVRFALGGIRISTLRNVAASIGMELPVFNGRRSFKPGENVCFTKLEAAAVIREYHRRRGEIKLRRAERAALKIRKASHQTDAESEQGPLEPGREE